MTLLLLQSGPGKAGIAAAAPVNTVLPAISGTATTGSTLSTTNGTWTGTPTITYAYQWKRNGSNISSATSSTYLLVSADVGTTTTVTVTATNASGSNNATSAGIVSATSEAAAFLARTSGLDTTHTNAYTALINGLVADGIWAKLDVLRIYATQNSTTALLNLVSSSYTGTANGSPTFTVDRGFTGVEASSTVYINSGFNPTTAASPKFIQDSAHISQWSINNTASQPCPGHVGPSAAANAYLFKYSGDNRVYIRINSGNIGGNTGTTDISGHIIGCRVDAGDWTGYRNGSLIGGAAVTHTALQNLNFYELGTNNNGSPSGAGNQFAAVSWGSLLTATDATNFYNRLRTYMTVVGVP